MAYVFMSWSLLYLMHGVGMLTYMHTTHTQTEGVREGVFCKVKLAGQASEDAEPLQCRTQMKTGTSED